MDPNILLTHIRRLAPLGMVDTDDLSESDIGNLAELANLVSSLDQWLTRGGFLPDDWDHKMDDTPFEV